MFNTPPTQYDVSFSFYGFPVRVHPLFWIVFSLFGVMFHSTIDEGNLAFWLVEIVIWVAAVFVSVLAHELGHALVFRHVFRVPSAITLHGFGGVTVPYYAHRRKPGFFGLVCEVFLSAAGALAEFFLAGLLIMLLALMQTAGLAEVMKMGFFLGALNPTVILVVFMMKVIFISIFWGLFNLLPIYPMDGGQISREIFSYFSPRHGVGNSLVLSMVVAILMAIFVVRLAQPFIAILFVYFAYQNYRELSFRSFRP